MAIDRSEAGNQEMTAEQYAIVQKFLENSSGIVLGENKQYLVKNRLSDVLIKCGLQSFGLLTEALQSGGFAVKQIKTAVIDAMTTNETSWFRDDQQFVELKEKLLPDLLKSKGQARIWSAACSSGQEPYTISICAEILGKSGYSGNVQILGTDISESVLTEAKQGIYSETVLARGVDASVRDNYFNLTNRSYQLRPEILRRVKFQQFNLLDSFVGLGKFDVIFCRNVLIYFSSEVKVNILQRMLEALNHGGYLFLSSTESMPSNITQYELVRGGRARYFRKTG